MNGWMDMKLKEEAMSFKKLSNEAQNLAVSLSCVAGLSCSAV